MLCQFLPLTNKDICMKKSHVIIGIIILAFSTLSFAQDKEITFDQLDDDVDGYLSQGEAGDRPDLKKNWKSIDTNADDKLDISEFSAFEAKERFTPPEDMEEPEIGAAPTN